MAPARNHLLYARAAAICSRVCAAARRALESRRQAEESASSACGVARRKKTSGRRRPPAGTSTSVQPAPAHERRILLPYFWPEVSEAVGPVSDACAARSLCKSIWTRHVVLFKQNHVASLDLARVGSGLRDATNPRRTPFWSVPTLVAQAAPVMLMLPPCCVCFSGEILGF